ncbi:MAG TPA: MOSC domain-containing protein, partial [Planctomycetota bacterium]|nr:MOSC domain-containing protein [Planctomycetota bacterium]
ISIYTSAKAGDPMRSVDSINAIAGRGLEGDRYFDAKKKPGQQVTLIEREAVEALGRDYGATLAPGDARRNLVTDGVALNHLVGREFTIGDVRFRGVRLCEPCTHLQQLTGVKVLPGLVHRGGLRAEIVTGGELKTGQEVKA